MMEGPLLYHEKQEAALCGVHALNTLLQGPYFTAVDLSQIAQELDALEKQYMAESGIEGEDFVKFLAEESGNVSSDGFFSIQVLSKAMEVFGLSCANLDSADCVESAAHPEREQAFLCNLREHWFALRRVGGDWWDFNSLSASPKPLSEFYLSAYLATLRDQGYSIFVVRGALPGQFPDPVAAQEAPGSWFTPEQAKAGAADSAQARQSGYLKAAAKGALAQASQEGTLVALKPRANGLDGWDGLDASAAAGDEDEDLSRAIAASLAQENGAGTSAPAEPHLSAQPQPQLQPSAPAAAESAHDRAERSPPPAAQEAAAAPEDPGPEPDPGPGVVEVAIRLPHGERIMRRFCAAQPVGAVLEYARFRCPGQVGLRACIALQMPRRVLGDTRQSLREAGVTNRETLTITC